MHKLVLIRHGESVWDLENRFTGWADVDLTETGLWQAKAAGQRLKAEGFEFDLAYTSMLKRATRTLWHVLDELDSTWLPVVNAWRLNGRHWGALQGHTHAEVVHQHGVGPVRDWLEGHNRPPPALQTTDPRCERHDVRYRKLKPEQIPLTESLRDAQARVMPFWHEALAPALKLGKRGLVVAHDATLRGLIQQLAQLSDHDTVALTIPNGIPLVYELDNNLKPIRHYHLGDAGSTTKVEPALAEPSEH